MSWIAPFLWFVFGLFVVAVVVVITAYKIFGPTLPRGVEILVAGSLAIVHACVRIIEAPIEFMKRLVGTQNPLPPAKPPTLPDQLVQKRLSER